jgi:hypothetical protein
MSINQAKVTCPRCGHEWIVPQGETEIDCNCHLFCERGSKPSDCSLSAVSFDHQVGWPYGVHTGNILNDEDPVHLQNYCSTHDYYTYKTPITIHVDWDSWRSRRAPKKYRLIQP